MKLVIKLFLGAMVIMALMCGEQVLAVKKQQSGQGKEASFAGDDTADDRAASDNDAPSTQELSEQLQGLKKQQTQQFNTLKASVKELGNEQDPKKRSVLADKTKKLVSSGLDQLHTALDIGIPIFSILVFISAYQAMRAFFGLNQSPYMYTSPSQGTAQAYQQTHCTSLWSNLFDSRC